VRFGAGGVLAGLLRSSCGLLRWCEVVGGYVAAFGRVWCVVDSLECGVVCGVGVVRVVGFGGGGVLVVLSIVGGVYWGIIGVVGGGSKCVL
jgi:hypothetical protein